jgi:hypothetical protein
VEEVQVLSVLMRLLLGPVALEGEEFPLPLLAKKCLEAAVAVEAQTGHQALFVA